MASVTLRDVPDHIHRLLKLRAKSSRRSLNQEILRALELYVERSESVDIDNEISALRNQVRVGIDDELLAKYRKQGRS